MTVVAEKSAAQSTAMKAEIEAVVQGSNESVCLLLAVHASRKSGESRVLP